MTNNKMFSQLILHWYKKNKRNLPWRKTKEPYKIWVSEIILQQTQISQGINYYLNFIKTFPNLKSLSKSTESNVLKTWEGLGYYSRAINMLNNAKLLVKQNKTFPNNYNELIKLKGIGEYTASAISSICKNEKKAVLDGNVFRVISRVFNISDPINQSRGKKKFHKITFKLLPEKNIGDYNQALMDFGSIHCTIKTPKCDVCPIKNMCQSFKIQNIQSRPVKFKKNTTKKTRNLNYLIISCKENLYIKKRLQNDIWKNLYDLPIIETNEGIRDNLIIQALASNFKDFKLKNFVLIKKTQHKLSHQNLNLFFWEITTSKLKEKKSSILLKVPFQEVSQYPFPKPISKYLDEYLIT